MWCFGVQEVVGRPQSRDMSASLQISIEDPIARISIIGMVGDLCLYCHSDHHEHFPGRRCMLEHGTGVELTEIHTRGEVGRSQSQIVNIVLSSFMIILKSSNFEQNQLIREVPQDANWTKPPGNVS